MIQIPNKIKNQEIYNLHDKIIDQCRDRIYRERERERQTNRQRDRVGERETEIAKGT